MVGANEAAHRRRKRYEYDHWRHTPWAGVSRPGLHQHIVRRSAAIRQGCGQSRFSCSQVCCETEEGEEQVVVVFGFADGGGDVLVAGLADEAHDEVTESGKGAGAGSGPDLGRVLAEGDIADKVDWTSHCSLTVGVRLEQAFLGGG